MIRIRNSISARQQARPNHYTHGKDWAYVVSVIPYGPGSDAVIWSFDSAVIEVIDEVPHGFWILIGSTWYDAHYWYRFDTVLHIRHNVADAALATAWKVDETPVILLASGLPIYVPQTGIIGT